MRFEKLSCVSGMCSGSTSRTRLYFRKGGTRFFWDEIFPSTVRRFPPGEVSKQEREELVEALRQELKRHEFTPAAFYFRQAIAGLKKQEKKAF